MLTTRPPLPPPPPPPHAHQRPPEHELDLCKRVIAVVQQVGDLAHVDAHDAQQQLACGLWVGGGGIMSAGPAEPAFASRTAGAREGLGLAGSMPQATGPCSAADATPPLKQHVQQTPTGAHAARGRSRCRILRPPGCSPSQLLSLTHPTASAPGAPLG